MIGFLVLFCGFIVTTVLSVALIAQSSERNAKRTGEAGSLGNMGLVYALLFAPVLGVMGSVATGLFYLLYRLLIWHTFDIPLGLAILSCIALSVLGWRYLTKR